MSSIVAGRLRLPQSAWLSVLLFAALAACSDGSGGDENTESSAGAGGSGLSSSGGSGGVGTGGSAQGGVGTGGAGVGGAGRGGAGTGGSGVGGAGQGGAGTGGSGFGGMGVGGTGTGGAGVGGSGIGGAGVGGTGLGGMGVGGLGLGGSGTGGSGLAGSGTAGSGVAGSGLGGAITAGAENGGAGELGGAAGSAGSDPGTGGATGSKFRIYLMIGQSNMTGNAQASDQDKVEDERIKVLGYDDCGDTGRVYNEWDVAAPPLHACWSKGIGPGDYFAKTLIEALPAGDTIGLIPCGIAGVDIDFFRKGVTSERRGEFTIPPDNHWDTAYDWVIERAQIAQEAGGVIDGIIFHQGESDSGRQEWLDEVNGMVEDLRADLGTGEIPFLAGELLYSGACAGHNSVIAQLPQHVTNSFVISAEGLNGVDQFHFDIAGYRTLGQRYGETMIEALGLSGP